jgi:hypothetical protein
MGNSGGTVGIILLVVSILVFLGGAAVSLTATGVSTGGAVLGVVFSLIIAIPLAAGGVFLLVRSRAEAGQQVDAVRQRKILDIVKTQGQVDISHIVFELNSTTDQVRDDIYKLVGMGLFSGYVNWDKGTLYTQEASQLRQGNTCPNCGGELALAGKGVITCRNCGTDIFL